MRFDVPVLRKQAEAASGFMNFISETFGLFFAVVFVVYYLQALTIRSLLLRNLIVLTASYIFYGYWDYRFLALIVFSSTVDFVAGHLIDKYCGTCRSS